MLGIFPNWLGWITQMKGFTLITRVMKLGEVPQNALDGFLVTAKQLFLLNSFWIHGEKWMTFDRLFFGGVFPHKKQDLLYKGRVEVFFFLMKP